MSGGAQAPPLAPPTGADLCLCADMIRRRSLRTRAIKMLVLDEADEMLNKGVCVGGGVA